MPEDINIPGALLKLELIFIDHLKQHHLNNNTRLKYDDAAERATKLLRSKQAISPRAKISVAEIKRFVKYLIKLDKKYNIAYMDDGCFWANTSADYTFAMAMIRSKKKYIDELLDDMAKIEERLEIMESTSSKNLFGQTVYARQ